MVGTPRKRRVTITRPEPLTMANLGAGLFVPTEYRATIDDPGLPGVVDLEVRLHGNAYRVEELRLSMRPSHGAPVTSEALRQIPVADLLRSSAALAIPPWRPTSREYVSSPRELRSRAADDPEFLHAVAAAYRLAALVGTAPTIEVANKFNISRATAGRLIADVRAIGILGGAPLGRAGESDEDDE